MKHGMFGLGLTLGLLLATSAHAQQPENWLPLLSDGKIIAHYNPTIDEAADYPFNASYEVKVDFNSRPLRGQATELIAYLSVTCEADQVLRLAASAYDTDGNFLRELSTQLVGDDHEYLNAQLPAGLGAALFEKVCNKKQHDF